MKSLTIVSDSQTTTGKLTYNQNNRNKTATK